MKCVIRLMTWMTRHCIHKFQVFTAWCYAERGILLQQVVYLPIFLSVRDADVSWSHRLEYSVYSYFENNFTVS